MRWLVFLIIFARAVFAAEPGEAEAFASAAKAAQDGFYERAEKAWVDFLARFSKSEHAAEAGLALAQARHQLKQYPAALEALNTRLPEAGALADQYRFWKGQILLDATHFEAAEQAFAEMLKTHTNSPLRLSASVAQAQSRFRRDEFAGVVELLGGTNSVFQQTARDSTNVAQVARGYLILTEAQIRRNDLAGARAALQALAGKSLPPDLDWERWQTLARIEFAGPAPEQAIPALTNAVAKARLTRVPLLQAQTLNLEAEVYKRLNQPARAVQSYEGIIAAEGMPPEQKQLALLKEVELSASQNAFTNAASRIAAYLVQNPKEPAADLLNVKAGEYLLDAYRQQSNKTIGPGTNLIADARRYFDTVLQQYTNSAFAGKAWLDRGWTLWEEHLATGNGQRLVEGQAAFQAATEKLPPGEEQILARFKLGDVQFKQGIFPAAATNLETVLKSFGVVPNLRTNLIAQAAEQLIRTYLAQTNLAGADAILQRTIALFPDSPYAQESWLVMGQTCAEIGQLEKARAILKQFTEKFPQSPLRPDAELAYARTFALDAKWPEAIDLYTKWTAANTAHAALAQAEFDRAWLNSQAGNTTNAFQLFTNFVTRFPTNALSARAQNWIADYFYNQEQWLPAEQNYQRVFQNTNVLSQELGCQARLMAARTAFFRQNYSDARGYLTNLISGVSCSPDIEVDAYFLLGDVLIAQRAPTSTNLLANFSDAIVAFDRITRRGATNRLEPLAWGKMGDCYFQTAAIAPEDYDRATNAYYKVLESKRTDVPVLARNVAELGIAAVLEKLADIRPKDPKERDTYLRAALDHYLNVVYSTGLGKNRSDPAQQKRAALNASRLTEVLTPDAAPAFYRRLLDEIPSLRSTWEAKLKQLESR